jgi:hypothetical protein
MSREGRALAVGTAPGRAPRVLSILASRGPTVQAVVPGLYAWSITVAPVGWSRHSSALAGLAAGLGLLALLAAPIVERRSTLAARVLTGWGLVVSATLTWALAPEPALDAFDVVRGVAGLVGWGLFAIAVASPARAIEAPRGAAPTKRRWALDTWLLAMGVALALAIEVPGWRLAERDRALFLRVVALAGGLGLLSAAGALAVAVHGPIGGGAAPGSRARRIRSLAWAAGAAVLLGGGVAYEVWRGTWFGFGADASP